VGCGRIAPKAELVRLAVAPGAGGRTSRRAVLDVSYRLQGRGAYLCRAGAETVTPDEHCLQLALRRGGIARTLRCSVALDLDDRSPQTSNS
jgi:predicted RNA-binding protein YlxR (DUF448 family)